MRRRRFLKVLAGSVAGLSLHRIAEASNTLQPVRWQGFALGAEGQFTLYTDRPLAARQVLEQCFAEIRRLEACFSLYDHQSELCQLNRTGRLTHPSPEWLELLRAADRAHRDTAGAFDPTVQPLWRLYARHFENHPTSLSGPPAAELDSIRQRVGWDKVDFHGPDLRFTHPGVELTLNGIAQGYITDRIAALLQDAGYAHVLIELGETRAIGAHPESRPWKLGIPDATHSGRLHEIIELADRALATSGAYGSPFSTDGRYHHLIDPDSGLPGSTWKSISVTAPTATEADAFSTGLSFADATTLQALRRQRPDLSIHTQA